MEKLGRDELFSIFNKLDNRKDVLSFSLVSRQFLAVSCSVSCFHRTTFFGLFPFNFVYDILPSCPNLKRFICMRSLSNDHMKLLATSCPNLSRLEIDVPWPRGDFAFDFNDDGLCAVANACSRLSTIYLSGRLNFGHLGIHSVITSCKNLTFLHLGGCVGVNDESLKAIGGSNCLLQLRLQVCNLITDLGLKYLANGDLKNCLHTLYLSECDRIGDNGIIHLKQMVLLSNLDLSKCGVNVTDTGIVILFSQLSNIEKLNLSWLINVTDASLSVIAKKCLKLIDIELNGCEAITGGGLRAFAHHPMLEWLELLSCHNFSWEDDD